MSLLLDTQMLIWLEEQPQKIKASIRERIATEDVIFFSLVSIWEMAIKTQIGKLALKQSLEIIVSNFINDYSFQILNINKAHIYETLNLPAHHKDPFDRLIIAQAIVENIEIVSSDDIFDLYAVKRIRNNK